jgi:membrane associated rhomboid family serine protease
MVGASGAVAGVLGAYLRLFPHARILALVPLGFFFFTVVWPAGVFLGIWIALQVFNAFASIGVGSGVAWWAHVGGFAFGFLVVRALEPKRRTIEVTFGDDRYRR